MSLCEQLHDLRPIMFLTQVQISLPVTVVSLTEEQVPTVLMMQKPFVMI